MHKRLRFDENWYFEAYPDVKQAFRRGLIPSLVGHYLRHGVAEGRLPHAPDTSTRRVFAYGSYGTNNVGDEAILEGVRKLYPKCHQFYMNRMRNGPGSFPNTALEQKDFFQEGDLLIIGGGGLLYDAPTVKLMADLAETASRAGATVDICRLGCEAASDKYCGEISRLFGAAEKITVRSTNSQKIMSNLLGETFPVEFDFAFNLRPDVPPRNSIESEITIGLVTASLDDSSLERICELVVHATRSRAGRKVNIAHFPQSRSYFNEGNNDVIMGERIWIASKMQHAASHVSFRTMPYVDEPIQALAQYINLDGIISSRYHGLIFGNLCNLPTLGVGKSQPKVGGFIDDHRSAKLIGADYDNLNDTYDAFLEIVIANRNQMASNGSTIGANR
jgi:polysaccharide pyruvyl transferase WcaK-like protein